MRRTNENVALVNKALFLQQVDSLAIPCAIDTIEFIKVAFENAIVSDEDSPFITIALDEPVTLIIKPTRGK